LWLPAAAVGQTVLANGEIVDDEASLERLVAAASAATIVQLVADPNGPPELLHRAQARIVARLHAAAGYDVLVMPVGIFEGHWVDSALSAVSMPASLASWPVYRVWRESPGFRSFMERLHTDRASGAGVTVIGGLSRFHAIGKTLYTPHLVESLAAAGAALPVDLGRAIEHYWAGPGRLARSTPEFRRQAAALVPLVLQHLDAMQSRLSSGWGGARLAFERQFLTNMATFVELEQMRAGDIPENPEFAVLEQGANLEWFLTTGFPGRRLIVWEGSGETIPSLTLGVPVHRVDLTVAPPG
jgi:hypothetical protein